jgi:hypothetical protein
MATMTRRDTGRGMPREPLIVRPKARLNVAAARKPMQQAREWSTFAPSALRWTSFV